MAKLTIEIEQNEFSLWDVTAIFDDQVILDESNYTSEWVGLTEARYKAWAYWRKSND